MVKKEENRSEIKGDTILNSWADNYTAISKMWGDSYLNLYKPWLGPKRELFEKVVELSKEATPQKYQEFYNLWAKTYQKAFENFFEHTPTAGPFKEVFEPVKNAARIYADTFISVSKIWVK